MFLARIGANRTRLQNVQPRLCSAQVLRPRLAMPCPPSRTFLSWLFNPKEESVAPTPLQAIKVDELGHRLLYWDSTHSTPHLKPEFNDRLVSSLSTGIAHSCAVVDGNIHAWGSNYYSQVGLTTESFHEDDAEEVTDVHFVNQLGNEEIVQVASGNFHNLALSKSGKLWSWGSGCLGRGDEIYDSLPQSVEFFHALGRDIKQIFAAGNYSMALVSPQNGHDDELYIWGYIPFGDADESGQVTPMMRKSLRPLLVTSVLGYKISHVACSPWHFTLAATPATAPSDEVQKDTRTPVSKPFLMTFGRYSDDAVLEKPYSPLFLDLAPEDEFYEVKPWRIFRSVSPSSELVINKIAASKGCDIVLMENGSIGISDHEDHVARLIHRPLEVKIVDVAGGSSEVLAVSEHGQVLSWSEQGASRSRSDAVLKDDTKTTAMTKDKVEMGNANGLPDRQQPLPGVSPSSLHPLLDFTKDPQQAETEVLAFFDSQRLVRGQKVRLVEALFESSRLVVEKPGLSKCVAQYDRFTLC